MTQSFADRLRLALDEEQVSVPELSRRSGVGESTIRNWLSAKPSVPSAEYAAEIAHALNISLQWLIAGRGEMRTDELRDWQIQQEYDAGHGLDDESDLVLPTRKDQGRLFKRLRDSTEKVYSAFDTAGWFDPPTAVAEAFKSLTLIYDITQDDLNDAAGMIRSAWDGRDKKK